LAPELNAADEKVSVLLFRVGKVLCAFPISSVIEVMRRLPALALSNMAPLVMGVGVIRGDKVPIVDLGELFGLRHDNARRTRLVTIRVGPRAVALAVDSVIGVRELDRTLLAEVPPLLRSAHPDELTAMGLLDRELFMVLDGSRLVSEELFARISNR
jgi:purine-binding chemotaxis protein CheW